MAIGNLSEQEFVKILQEHLRPSRPIDSFEHLYGRENQLELIKQAIYSPGRHVFIYGDRGVGKTSLALTAAFKHNPADGEPPFVACGIGSNFFGVIDSIILRLRDRQGIAPAKETIKTSVGVRGFGYEKTVQRDTGNSNEVSDLNSAMAAFKSLCPVGRDRQVVVVDEVDRLASEEEQAKFAEFIKQLGDQAINVAFIFCGIGKSLDELLAAHASCYRYLEGIELPRLNVGSRWEIIDRSSGALGIKVNEDSRFRISAISDGFPHYVHLVCEKLYWRMFNDEEILLEATPEHYQSAIAMACQSIESHLRQAYDKATKKDNDVYQEVLWALADHFELSRNVDAVYKSYIRIMEVRNKAPLGRKQFVSRLNNLKSPRHGKILCSSRRSWYEFSENMVRGYVRLRAEDQGVRLAIEHEPSAEPPRWTVGRLPAKPSGAISRPTFGGDPYSYLERKQRKP